MKPWTTEEMEYLDTYWGTKSISAIASHLCRTVNAVKNKAIRCGYTRHIHSGTMITLNQLAEAVNRSYSVLNTTWINHGLPIKYRKSINRKYKMIDIEDFWRWAATHKHLIDFSKIENGILGKEPEWVKEARHASYSARKNTMPWTDADDFKLKTMLKAYKYTYADLSKELNRSEGAIKRRIFDLSLMERPMRKENRKWTDEETAELIRLVEVGYCFEDIGIKLNRTGSCVRGKYERILNPDYTKQYYRKQRKTGDYEKPVWVNRYKERSE